MARIKIGLGKLGRRIEQEVNAMAEKEFKTVAFDILGTMIRRTPVDTGRAQSNWNISVGSPDTHTTESTTPNPNPEVDARGIPIIYIANGLPYVQELDEGKSRDQAPGGIVALSIQEVKSRR